MNDARWKIRQLDGNVIGEKIGQIRKDVSDKWRGCGERREIAGDGFFVGADDVDVIEFLTDTGPVRKSF